MTRKKPVLSCLSSILRNQSGGGADARLLDTHPNSNIEQWQEHLCPPWRDPIVVTCYSRCRTLCIYVAGCDRGAATRPFGPFCFASCSPVGCCCRSGRFVSCDRRENSFLVDPFSSSRSTPFAFIDTYYYSKLCYYYQNFYISERDR